MTKTDSGLRIAETKETSSQDGEDMEQVREEARAAQVNAVRAHTGYYGHARFSSMCNMARAPRDKYSKLGKCQLCCAYEYVPMTRPHIFVYSMCVCNLIINTHVPRVLQLLLPVSAASLRDIQISFVIWQFILIYTHVDGIIYI